MTNVPFLPLFHLTGGVHNNASVRRRFSNLTVCVCLASGQIPSKALLRLRTLLAPSIILRLTLSPTTAGDQGPVRSAGEQRGISVMKAGPLSLLLPPLLLLLLWPVLGQANALRVTQWDKKLPGKRG